MRSEVESDARAKLENKCMRVNYTQHMQSVEILAIILAREMKIFVYHVRTLMMIDKFSWWVKLNLVLFDMVFLQLTTLGRSTQNIIYSKIYIDGVKHAIVIFSRINIQWIKIIFCQLISIIIFCYIPLICMKKFLYGGV